MKMTETKPLLTAATLTATASAVIALLVAFGVQLTPEQTAAILGVVGVLAPFVVWALSTNKVVASARVVEELDLTSGVVIAGQANDMVPVGDTVRVIDPQSRR